MNNICIYTYEYVCIYVYRYDITEIVPPPPGPPVAAHSGANSPRCDATPGMVSLAINKALWIPPGYFNNL